MKKQISYDSALNTLAAHCSAAERCVEDIYRKMENWELIDQEKDDIVAFLQKENFLNEERFARAYTNDKYKFSKWGKKKIVQGMYMKGVDGIAIQAGIESIDMELYLENLKEILLTKQKSIKADDEYELKNKLIRFAMGRGYDYGDIIHVMPNLEVF